MTKEMENEMENEIIENLIKAARMHNEEVDRFLNEGLREHFGETVESIGKWFDVQAFIAEQNFYDKGTMWLKLLRSYGIDCKMDMQNNKLVINGMYI